LPHCSTVGRFGIKKPVTLKDIALATGVDVSAVSRVLNNARTGTRVSEARRQLIMETARRMRYQPNALARNLDGRRIGMLGVVLGATVDLILHPYTGSLLQGVVDGATEANYQPILYTTSWEDAEKDIGVFCDRRADGLIVFSPPKGSTIIPRLLDYGLPVVGFDLWPGEYICNQIGLDEHSAFRTAVKHLQELGHRHIGYVCHIVGTHYSTYRNNIVADVFEELKVEKPEFITLPTHLPLPKRSEPVREFLTSRNRPTAVITFNDYVALSILDEAQDLGVSIPGELSVIGFDNLLEASQSNPPLTTFSQPTREMGKEAVRMLLTLTGSDVDEAEPPTTLTYQPELVPRGSTGPARRGR
jgi:LacI family transcriptional regulator